MGLLSIAFVLIYFSLGIGFIIAGTTLFDIPKIQQQILGGVFILYSIYRSYILYGRYFGSNEDNRQFSNTDEDDIQ
ncbi:MAG TPA: hypothetical protein VLZ54_06690 [Arenibacter sp.]|nr:hypothetical protein [Arenibacter sp.]